MTKTVPDPQTDRALWMTRGTFGLMVHWLAPGPQPEKGERIPNLDRTVDAFNVSRFLADFHASGADWLIFTIGQNSGFYAGPNATLDKFVGKPGHCSRRDLVGEIAHGVHAQKKRFIAYLPAEVAAQSHEIHQAFAWNPADQSEFQTRYCAFIRDYALRLGKHLDGWWFDGCYTWDVFPNAVRRWSDWCDAARAGNPDAALAFNDGSFCIGETRPPTPLQDYLSGEVEQLRDGAIRLGRGKDAPTHLPQSRFIPGTRCQWHALLPIDCGPDMAWAHDTPGPMGPPRFSDAELFAFVKRCRAAGGAVTLNVGIYQEGHLGAATLDQLQRLRGAL